MLTYADRLVLCQRRQVHAYDGTASVLTYADVCGRILTYPDVS